MPVPLPARFLLSLLCILCTATAFGQSPILPNEARVFSFEVKGWEGDAVVLAQDTNEQYLVYRYFRQGKLIMEFPQRRDSSWEAFEYTYYFRADRGDSSGVDVNYLEFTYKDRHFVVYDLYFEPDREHRVGVRITTTDSGLTYDTQGIPKTAQGRLSELLQHDRIRSKVGQLFE